MQAPPLSAKKNVFFFWEMKGHILQSHEGSGMLFFSLHFFSVFAGSLLCLCTGITCVSAIEQPLEAKQGKLPRQQGRTPD